MQYICIMDITPELLLLHTLQIGLGYLFIFFMFYVVILQNAPLKKQISLGRSEFTSSQYNKKTAEKLQNY